MLNSPSVEPRSWFQQCLGQIRANRALFVMMVPVVLIALIPLYGILFPPLVDLPEHLLISKLLWEKLSGVSHLDLEISLFLGYRLFPALMMVIFPLCKLAGISLIYLPKIVTATLVSLHAVVVVTILYFGLRERSWKSITFAICLAVPAAVVLYSACWFIGFVNYTLAVTLLIPAIFLMERFLRTGRASDISWLFLNLALIYTAHPFAITFWAMWCGGRGIASIVTGSFRLEWKRLILLALLFAPILLYHYGATAGTELAPSNHHALSKDPFISKADWYNFRLRGLIDGVFLQPDDAANSRVFAWAALGLILLATILAFSSRQNRSSQRLMLSSLFLLGFSSWINERYIPVPQGAWLAFDYRFSSTSYTLGLAVAGLVLVRLAPVQTSKAAYKLFFVILAILSVGTSLGHLVEVQKAYARFDDPARKYMDKVFKHEKPVGIYLPHSKYHPDGTFLNNYVCLVEPDCNVPGTTFAQGHVDSLYPVRIRRPGSPRAAGADGISLISFPSSLLARLVFRPRDDGLVGYWKLDELNRGDACIDSTGRGRGGTVHGTTVAAGQVGRCRSFNGTGDCISIPTISVSDAITVSAWVYSDEFAQNGFVVTKNPVNTQWALFFEADGTLKWRGVGASQNVVCRAPSNNAWHHIVGKQQGIAGSLYVDGTLCATATLPPIGNAPSTITIGCYDSVAFNYFRGQIDEVRIYNRALSDAEISKLFQASDSKNRAPVSPAPK